VENPADLEYVENYMFANNK
jgi:hypothetical protein